MARKVFISQKTKAPINTGGVDVGTSVVAVSAFTRQLEGGVQVVADATNTDIVYIGVRSNLTAGTNDDTDGFPLSSGESLFLPVDSESDMYMIADAVSQKIFFASY
jgi:hypothetical protein